MLLNDISRTDHQHLQWDLACFPLASSLFLQELAPKLPGFGAGFMFCFVFTDAASEMGNEGH